MSRFLFIGHDASRSGAPFVLLYLLKWLNTNHPEHRVDLLLLSGGELEAEYRAVANVHVLAAFSDRGFMSRAVRRVRGRWNAAHRLRTHGLPHFGQDYDVVVGNTVATLRHLALFKDRGFRTVNWLHELDRAVETLGMTDELKASPSFVDRFIVGSNSVAAMLRRFGISTQVDRIYEFSPRGTSSEIDIPAVRAELGLPVDAFVVGACGTIESRKGSDLFVRLADTLLNDHPEFRFLWIARKDVEADPLYRDMAEAIGSSHLADRVMIVRSDESPEKFLAALDVFVLTSREDPFPLVCLEAANLGKPVVCFADAGGMPEFVGDDAGAVVPFEDIDAMSRVIAELHLNPEKRINAGKKAQQKAQTDFSTETACSSIYSAITSI